MTIDRDVSEIKQGGRRMKIDMDTLAMMLFSMGTQILTNQAAVMRRLSAGWTEENCDDLCKRIGQTAALLSEIRKLRP